MANTSTSTHPGAFTAHSSLTRRFFPIILLCLLLAFPSISVRGAADGLLLWFNVVLPTLSPFLICTQLVVALDGVRLLTSPFYPFLHAVFGLSLPGCYVLLCGLLCGYPLGAKLCADFCERGKITPGEANYLLSICNHPSPMFLLGYVRTQLGMSVPPLLLLGCLYLPVISVSWISRRVYLRRHLKNQHIPDTCSRTSICTCTPTPATQAPPSLDAVLLSTAETMVIIGGYIMLFSILAAWIGRLLFLPIQTQAMLSGMAEITTGIHRICTVFPTEKALLPVIASAAFGGCSGIFQTKSVIAGHSPTSENAGLSIRHYTVWKAVHATLSCVFFLLLQNFDAVCR